LSDSLGHFPMTVGSREDAVRANSKGYVMEGGGAS
jgi:hypothetical protein